MYVESTRTTGSVAVPFANFHILLFILVQIRSRCMVLLESVTDPRLYGFYVA